MNCWITFAFCFMYPNWTQKYIPPEILSHQHLKIGFSQNGEDEVVRRFFWDEILKTKKGKYIDIGCWHESLYSNTKILNLVGWSGIAVDANPDLQELWLRNRPADKFINACIGGSENVGQRKVDFYRFQRSEVSTICKKRAKSLVKEGWILRDKIKVELISLKEIIEKFDQIGIGTPDFISIDLEMVDFLDDLPTFLNELRPRLILIEFVGLAPKLININNSKETKALRLGGYEPFAMVENNIFAKPIV